MAETATAEAGLAAIASQAAPSAPASSEKSSKDTREAMIDRALDGIIGKDDNEPYDANYKPHAEPEKKAPEAKPEAKAQPEKTAEPKADKISPEDLARARTTLNFDNVPNALIDKMAGEDPKALLEWAKSSAKRQAEYNAKLRERAAADKTEQPRPDTKTKTDAPTEYAKYVATVQEELSTEGREAFKSLIAGIESKFSALERDQANRFQQSQYVNQRVIDMDYAAARESLSERFPQVKDDASWEALKEDAKSQAHRPGYDSIKSVLEDSARLRFSDANLAEWQRQTAEAHRARDKGQPSSPNPARAPQTPKGLTKEQKLEMAADLALDGFTSDQITKRIKEAEQG